VLDPTRLRVVLSNLLVALADDLTGVFTGPDGDGGRAGRAFV
jgi:hypothetical protein